MPRVPAAQLERILRDVYEAVGAPPDEAATVAAHQVEANLAGHDSHGIIRTPGYVSLVERGHIVPGAPIEVRAETPTTAVVDGNWGFGFVVSQRALRMAVAKARAHGVAAVTVRRQGHVGRLGAYTRQAADEGLIGLATADSGQGPKAAAPFGGRARRLGTNPLSIAVPAEEVGPVVLDMATSTVAGGKVAVARSRGQRLPPHTIIDRDGNPSTDPNDYYDGGALLPLGAEQGQKGYGLSFMVEVLSGLLTGIGFGMDPDGIHNDGVLIAALSVAHFRDPAEFERDVRDFIAYLKSSPLAAGATEVLYPGELEDRTAHERRAHGIDVEDATWEELTALSTRLGVAV